MKRAPTSSALPLSQAEQRLLNDFRTMDHRAKGETLLFTGLQARNYPEPPPPPTLRLIRGGAS
jgi:hypothetical protein